MQFTDVGGGVIDSDYRGPVSVVFFNFSSRYFEAKKGQGFPQIIFQKIAWPTLRDVLAFDDKTQRDTGAFGSSDRPVNKGIDAFWFSMAEKMLVNKYIPEYVPSDLKWYERDGLLTYID